jgi:hypothetical protein
LIFLSFLEIRMLRCSAFVVALLCSTAVLFAASTDSDSKTAVGTVQGVVADPTGAIVPNAEVNLIEADGSIAGTTKSDGVGNFLVAAPHAGNFTLVISEQGFETVHLPVTVKPNVVSATASAEHTMEPSLHITLPIATVATNVRVNGDTNEDLTASEENRDSSVLTSSDLKALPIFDNDYIAAMSSFLDDSASGTGGSGLIVDGVEANRATVSASAVQEVRINQDPYSAQYYWPGRGQMEVITKSAADNYHGEFNFLFRDSALNAQNALAPTKASEQRRVYEGSATGPIFFAKKSSFLASFNREEEDLNSVVNAIVVPTPDNPTGAYAANVPSPTRDTEFSVRAAHQFGEKHSAYAQYSYEDWTGQNQGVGGQTLESGGYNSEYHEDDLVFHVDSTLSPVLLNQVSLVGEHDFNSHSNVEEAPKVNVSGYFSGGSAQGDYLSTEYNLRFTDIVTWIRGRHTIKFGANVPHMSRRAYDDNTNEIGTYTFGPTVSADGTVEQSALDNYTANLPSAFSQSTGDVHFVYHQQEMGAFIQDQFKVNERFSITPGIRYDWQNFLATKRLGFAPRVSFAYVLDQDSKLVLRGGGGIYYDRFGPGPLLDLVRYENARRRAISIALDPATLPPSGCVPITNCTVVTEQPPNLARLAPNAAIPYQAQYGVSIERQIGQKATAVVSGYSTRGIHQFRSVDINAPTPWSGYTERPDAEYGRIRQMQPYSYMEGSGLDVLFRGMVNKYFSGFGRYTWAHYESNTGGIGWYPQNQYDPNDEWGNTNFDRRQRIGMYAIVNQKSLYNISGGIFANTGRPWTITTGTDEYGDSLFNSRPDGVARNSETMPSYVDLDLRWGHEFAITGNKDEDAPRLGFSAGAFNVLNHPNPYSLDTVATSPTFGDVTTVGPARRIQLGMRMEF